MLQRPTACFSWCLFVLSIPEWPSGTGLIPCIAFQLLHCCQMQKTQNCCCLCWHWIESICQNFQWGCRQHSTPKSIALPTDPGHYTMTIFLHFFMYMKCDDSCMRKIQCSNRITMTDSETRDISRSSIKQASLGRDDSMQLQYSLSNSSPNEEKTSTSL